MRLKGICGFIYHNCYTFYYVYEQNRNRNYSAPTLYKYRNIFMHNSAMLSYFLPRYHDNNLSDNSLFSVCFVLSIKVKY